MAIKIRFDKANNPETPSFILATKNGKRFGQIPAHNINMIDSQDTPEVTFDVYKYENGEYITVETDATFTAAEAAAYNKANSLNSGDTGYVKEGDTKTER
jgi:hypothetical protein